MASATMTIRLSRKARDALTRIATLTHRTKSDLAAQAIEAYVAREKAIVDGIQSGLVDLQAGRTVGHDSAMISLEATIAAAERAKERQADLGRTHAVIPDKLRSGADPGSIVELRSPPMDPGASPG